MGISTKTKNRGNRRKAPCKGRARRMCRARKPTQKRTKRRSSEEELSPELLALISSPPALTRCSEKCPHHSGCGRARTFRGKTCPIEENRYGQTVTALLRYCLARGGEFSFLLLRSVADIAVITVQIERAERYTVEKGFFYEQRKTPEDPNMVRLQVQPIVDQINRLYERRRRDIKDIEKYLAQTGGKQRSADEEDGLNLAQRMVEFLQKAKPLLYASLAPNDGGKVSLEKWTYPGDTPEEAERCRREARRILASLGKKGAARRPGIRSTYGQAGKTR